MAARADDPPFRRIGIVGLGLVGGSVALAARRAWPEVEIVGVDRGPACQAAHASGVINDTRDGVSDLVEVDLIVLATPVLDIINEIDRIGRAALHCVVTDVGSTKRRVMAAASAAGLARFVGGHPIAGRERGGFAHARADLFDGRTWALMDGDHAPSMAAFVEGLGAQPRFTDAETHDRAMAYVSHAPQVLASSLMAAAGEAIGRVGLEWSGQGFADMTRVASSPADVWADILETNADFIADALGRISSQWRAAGGDVSDREGIQRLFREAARWREQRFPS